MGVCELMTKNDLDRDEKRIVDLFDDLEHIDPSSGKAEFQLAAYLGTLNSTEEVCVRRYSRCPMSSEEMMDIVRFHGAIKTLKIRRFFHFLVFFEIRYLQ